jgi:hypothetical protein
VVDLARNEWTASAGISGRFGPEYPLKDMELLFSEPEAIFRSVFLLSKPIFHGAPPRLSEIFFFRYLRVEAVELDLVAGDDFSGLVFNNFYFHEQRSFVSTSANDRPSPDATEGSGPCAWAC